MQKQTNNNEEYKSLSPAEFFKKNRQLCGYDNPTKAAYTTFREIFDNSLDACEIAGIPPNISLRLKTIDEGIYSFTSVDNGPGVPVEVVPKAFGKIFFGSKYILRQHRGELGMGGQMALLNSLVDTGKPYTVITATENDNLMHCFDLSIDLSKNEPVVHNYKSKQKRSFRHGVALILYSKANFTGALNRITSYLSLTVTICPYVTVTFSLDEKEIFRHVATTKVLPPKPKIVNYHPHGIDLEILKKIIKSSKYTDMVNFLIHSFQRIGTSSARAFLMYANIQANVDPHKLTREELVGLVDKLKTFEKFLSPDISCLSPVTEPIFLQGVKEMFNPDFLTYGSRRGVCEGHPIIVECVIAIGGNIGTIVEKNLPDPYRFSNRIPLLYDKTDCALTKAVSEAYPKMYGITEGTKLAVFLHMCSTHIPYKTAGKEYISPDYPEINKVIGNALKECLRKVKVYMSQRHRSESDAKRRSIFDVYLPLVAESLAPLSDKPKEELNDLLHKSLGRK